MVKKNFFYLVAVGALLTVGGCGLTQNNTQTSGETSTGDSSAEQKNVEVSASQPKDCGADMDCGDELIAKCSPGKFTVVDGRNNMIINVLNKEGDNCIVDSATDLTGAPEFMTKYDADKNNQLSLVCKIPLNTLTTYYELKGYIEVPDILAGCTGESMKLQQDLTAGGWQ